MYERIIEFVLLSGMLQFFHIASASGEIHGNRGNSHIPRMIHAGFMDVCLLCLMNFQCISGRGGDRVPKHDVHLSLADRKALAPCVRAHMLFTENVELHNVPDVLRNR